ncbi:d-isomer specific 2-hydroxyacid dehydrogenase NAD-binding protein [Acetobacter sp. CAG:977]|mgnify:FL=1|nr:d-isomer specific 2-hydroxyacid dehydrogenase NAD-binding protein [Acetobacter sp. CAG:977]
MVKVAYFNVDSITKAYYEKNPLKSDAKTVFFEKSPDALTPEELEKVKDAEVISVFVSAIDVGEKVLSQFPKLKLIAVRSTGYNNVDMDYCRSHGIELVNVPGYGDSTVAEYAFGLLLIISRKINRAFHDIKKGDVRTADYLGFDLKGRTIGIVGTGAIGRYMIRLAKGFEMNVLAYDLYPNEQTAKDMGFTYVSMDELLGKSDIVSLHCPMTKENYHLLDKEAFKKMKDGAIVINTARGELIDTEELYKALNSGKLGGAGLDVMEYETSVIHDDLFLASAKAQGADSLLRSLINHRLMQLPNVVVTPHVAFNSIDAVHRILKTANDNIDSFLSGKVVNSVLKK